MSLLWCLHLLLYFNITSDDFEYHNISSKFDFQGPGLKVKVIVAILKNLCHGSRVFNY